MKKKTFFRLSCIILFSVWINIASANEFSLLGLSPDSDPRVDYLERYITSLDNNVGKVAYYSSDVTQDDFSIISEKKYDVVLLYRNVLQKAAAAELLLPLDYHNLLDVDKINPDWIPSDNLLSYNGELYGVPFYYLAALLSLNSDAAYYSSFHMPEYPYSWNDLYLACVESDLLLNSNICLMYDNTALPAFVMQYISSQFYKEGTISFDNSDFRDALTAYAYMVRDGYIIDYNEQQDKSAVLYGSSFPIDSYLYPQVGECQSVIVDLYALCIPRNSDQLSKAYSYIAEFLTKECQQVIFQGDWSRMMLMDPSEYSDILIGYYPDYDENMRQYIVSHWVPRFSNVSYIQYLNQSGIIRDYISGKLSMDRLLTELQATWDSMLK